MSLALLYWSELASQPVAEPVVQPAAQRLAPPTPQPAGAGFVAYTGQASEPVRFVVN